MSTKQCNRCQADKSASEFAKDKTRPSGLSPRCKPCQRSLAKSHYTNNKPAYLARSKLYRQSFRLMYAAIKSLCPCLLCGEDEQQCIDFHHVDPAKKSFNVSYARQIRASFEDFMAELAKCISLCANCHRKHHAGLLSIVPSSIKLMPTNQEMLNAIEIEKAGH